MASTSTPASAREQHHLLVARVLRDRPHLHVVGNHGEHDRVCDPVI